jgi:hypothetical protein
VSARDALARIRARSTSPWNVADIGEMRTGDVPALVEGHETVLEIHQPEWTSDQHGGGYYRCSADHWTLDDQTPACPTVTAIETALDPR